MKIALLAIDYQIDIMHPDGKVARSAPQAQERGVIAVANRLLAHASVVNWLPILVRVGFQPGYGDHPAHSPFFGRARSAGALELGTRGTDFHPDLVIPPQATIIDKPRISAFYSTRLEAVLRANGIERLIVAGVSTAWTVQSTVRDAHDRDYRVIVVEDACAASTLDEHQSSLALLGALAEIRQSHELIGDAQ